MKKHAHIIAIAACCLTTAATAQTTKTPAPDCPAQYELIGGTLCMKFSNGDIVLPTPQVAAVRYTDANCRKGYEIMAANLCMSAKTGDIVFAAETPVTATARK